MANKISEAIETAASIAKGMSVTLKEMMSPAVTENYPDESSPDRSGEKSIGNMHANV